MVSVVRLSCKGLQDDRGGNVSASCVYSDSLEDSAPLGAGCFSGQKGYITTMRCLPKVHTKALVKLMVAKDQGYPLKTVGGRCSQGQLTVNSAPLGGMARGSNRFKGMIQCKLLEHPQLAENFGLFQKKKKKEEIKKMRGIVPKKPRPGVSIWYVAGVESSCLSFPGQICHDSRSCLHPIQFNKPRERLHCVSW